MREYNFLFFLNCFSYIFEKEIIEFSNKALKTKFIFLEINLFVCNIKSLYIS